MIRYALTIFLGAFLLFLVQPLIGKYILPWFGGGAGVWTVCLLFFQVMLLAGYAYAHVISRWLNGPRQLIVHGCLLVLAVLALRMLPPAESWRPSPEDDPAWRILVLLTLCLGLPYLVLASTGPLMQSWFARVFPMRSPYRLYALSNVGSLLALLSYPAVIEPYFTRTAQVKYFAAGFVLYALACAACGWHAWKSGRLRLIPRDGAATDSMAQPPASPLQTWIIKALWIALPACASIVLLSFTARLTENVAPIPLLWVVPLAVYLLTFIIAFEWPGLYNRAAAIVGVVAALWLMLGVMLAPNAPIKVQVACSMVVMFACCMACHGELYRLRPAPARLTSYYLAIAAGGALGGIFVSLIAPLIFTFNLEFYLGLFGSFAILLVCTIRDRTNNEIFGGAAARMWRIVLLLPMAGASIAAIEMFQKHLEFYAQTIYRSRNFYGVLSIEEHHPESETNRYFTLHHGRIIHGAQFMTPELVREPISYYGPKSGASLVMQYFPKQGPRHVGVIGLGVGTLATFGRIGDEYDFYEINPEIINLAKHPFAYLQTSPANVQVFLGDGRLTLERQESRHFDMLVLDAFNGDAVPVHLLTTEAFAIYRRHLNPDGVVLVNVSNSFIQLDLEIARLAEALGYEVRLLLSNEIPGSLINNASWMIMTNNRELLEVPEIKTSGLRPREGRPVSLWTDEYTNLFQILRTGSM